MNGRNNVEVQIRATNLTREAFAKVSEALKALEDQAGQTSKKTQSIGEQISGFFSKHRQSITAIGTAVAGAGALIGSLAAGVAVLGARGADVEDIRSTFAALTSEVGETADVMLGSLRQAVDGVVSDFDLMKTVNKGFSEGLRLNRDELALTGEAARVFADRIGVGVNEAFQTLIEVMATGRDMQLKLIGANIDGKKAVDEYAASVGKEASALSENEQILAKRNATLKMMREELERTGGVEEDFSDRLVQMEVGVQNFTDSLGVAIATSPVLSEVLGSVSDMMQEAFGDQQVSTVQTLIGWVNKAAIVLVDFAQVGVSGAKYLVYAWQGLKMIFGGIMTVVAGLGEGIAKVTATTLEMAAKLPGANKLLGGLAATARENALQLEGMRKSFQAQTVEALDNAGRQGAAIDTFNGKLGEMKARMIAAAQQQVDSAKIADRLVNAHRTVGQATGEASKELQTFQKNLREMSASLNTAAQNDAFELWVLRNKDAIKKLADESVTLGETMPANLKKAFLAASMLEANEAAKKQAEQIIKDREEIFEKGLGRINATWLDAQKIRLEAEEAADQEHRKRTLSTYEFEVSEIQAAAAKKRAALKPWVSGYQEALAAIEREVAEKMASARDKHNDELAQMQAATNSWGNLTKSWLDSMPDLLQKAFTGGGGLGGAVKGLFSQVGRDIGTKIFEGPLGQKLAEGAMKLFGSKIGGTIANLLGPLGGAIGSLLGPLASKIGGWFKGLFGGVSKEVKEARQSISDFQASLAKTLTAEQQAEAGGVQWKQTVIAVRDAYLATGRSAEEAEAIVRQLWNDKNPQAVKAAMEQINAVLEEQKAKYAELGKQVETVLGEVGSVAGQLPERFRPALEQLAQMGVLSKDVLAGLFDEHKVDVERMKSLAQEYGIELSALGPKFQQARLGETAQKYLEDLNDLEQGGADMNAVLAGMSDEISTLVQDSIHFGTTIPENMRPWLQRMVESGQLIDENGNKLTDLSKVNFSDPIKVGMDRIVERLDALLTGLGIKLPQAMETGVNAAVEKAQELASGVDRAIGRIPDRIDIDVGFNVGRMPDIYEQGGFTGDISATYTGAQHGGLFTRPTVRVLSEFHQPEVAGSPNAIVDAFAEAMKQVEFPAAGGGVTFIVQTPIATVGTIRELWNNELGPAYLEWLRGNDRGARTRTKQLVQ